MESGMNSTPVLPLTTNYPGYGYSGPVAGFDVKHGLEPGDANLVNQGAVLTHNATHANADGLGKLGLANQTAAGDQEIIAHDSLGKLNLQGVNSMEHTTLGYGILASNQAMAMGLGQGQLFLNESISRNSKENAILVMENKHELAKDIKEAMCTIKECIHASEINTLKFQADISAQIKDSEIRTVERMASVAREAELNSRLNRIESILTHLAK